MKRVKHLLQLLKKWARMTNLTTSSTLFSPYFSYCFGHMNIIDFDLHILLEGFEQMDILTNSQHYNRKWKRRNISYEYSRNKRKWTCLTFFPRNIRLFWILRGRNSTYFENEMEGGKRLEEMKDILFLLCFIWLYDEFLNIFHPFI